MLNTNLKLSFIFYQNGKKILLDFLILIVLVIQLDLKKMTMMIMLTLPIYNFSLLHYLFTFLSFFLAMLSNFQFIGSA